MPKPLISQRCRAERIRIGGSVFGFLLFLYFGSTLFSLSLYHASLAPPAVRLLVISAGSGSAVFRTIEYTDYSSGSGLSPGELGWNISQNYAPGFTGGFHFSTQTLSDEVTTHVSIPLWPLLVLWVLIWIIWVHRAERREL